MSDETGNFVTQGFGGDQSDFFDDPLVRVEIESQFGVVPVIVKNTN